MNSSTPHSALGTPQSEEVNILLVDDKPENLLALEAVLAGPGRHVVTVASGPEALKRVLVHDFAMILLDVQMPGMDGYETATLIRSRDRSQHVPIIFITAATPADTQTRKGYTLGAVDYLYKPIVPEILKAKVSVFADLFTMTARVKRQAESLEAANRQLEESARQLREAETKYRTLVEQIPAITYLSTAAPGAARAISYVSPQLEALLGVSPADWVADPQRWLTQVHPDDREPVLAELARCHTSGGPLRMVYRLLARDGRTVWVRDEAALVRDDQGGPSYLQGVMVDLTEHKQAEAAEAEASKARIEELERELRALEQMSAPPPTGVTARILGVYPLCEALPETWADLVQRYGDLVDLALEQRMYKVNHDLGGKLRAIAEQLGSLKGGPRDVVEMHSATVKRKSREVAPGKAHAYVEEGRLMVLELMGYLVGYYRNQLPAGTRAERSDRETAGGQRRVETDA